MVKILCKWIKAVFTGHLINIVKGNINRYFSKELALFENRYKICKTCPNRQEVIIGEICEVCGCPLESKLRVKEERCHENKW